MNFNIPIIFIVLLLPLGCSSKKISSHRPVSDSSVAIHQQTKQAKDIWPTPQLQTAYSAISRDDSGCAWEVTKLKTEYGAENNITSFVLTYLEKPGNQDRHRYHYAFSTPKSLNGRDILQVMTPLNYDGKYKIPERQALINIYLLSSSIELPGQFAQMRINSSKKMANRSKDEDQRGATSVIIETKSTDDDKKEKERGVRSVIIKPVPVDLLLASLEPGSNVRVCQIPTGN